METRQIELTPSLTSMRIIARTTEAVYLRLPRELQREAGPCSCEHCVADKVPAFWDTLVVPTEDQRHDWSYTVHMPDKAVRGFVDYMRAHGKLPKTA